MLDEFIDAVDVSRVAGADQLQMDLSNRLPLGRGNDQRTDRQLGRVMVQVGGSSGSRATSSSPPSQISVEAWSNPCRVITRFGRRVDVPAQPSDVGYREDQVVDRRRGRGRRTGRV